MNARIFGIMSLSVTLLSFGDRPPAFGDDDTGFVRVGVMHTLFDGKDDQAVFSQMQPFAELIKGRTGVDGEFSVIRSTDAMGTELAAGRLQLGVVHGIEYAWLKRRCPDCKPLVAAVNESTRLKAYLLIAKTNDVKDVAALQGQTLAQPSRAPMHTRLFLERTAGAPVAEFFKVREVANMDAAIDAVIDGQAQLTVISNIALDAYQSRKPGRFNRLRILTESPYFPPAVVVYRPSDKVRREVVQKFRDSLLKANATVEGRQTLTLWRLTGFQEVPDDYEQMAEAIGKTYPAPGKS